MDLINILFAKALNNGDTTKEYVDEAIKALKGEVNADLDTLEELSKALGNDPDFFLSVKNELDEKITQEEFNSAIANLLSISKQNLTAEQQAQARENIAAAGVEAVETALAGKLDNAPGTWPVWTDVEQAAARARMGIPGDYELIEEITLEEDTALFMRDAEPDGTSYNFKNVVVLITSAKAAFGNKTIYTRIHSGDKSQSSYCTFYENLKYYCRAVWRAQIENSELRFAVIDTTYIYSPQNAVSGDASTYKESPNCNIVQDNITKIEISCSDNIPVGFLIQIFGVRA